MAVDEVVEETVVARGSVEGVELVLYMFVPALTRGSVSKRQTQHMLSLKGKAQSRQAGRAQRRAHVESVARRYTFLSDWEQPGHKIMPLSLILGKTDAATGASGGRQQKAVGTLWAWEIFGISCITLPNIRCTVCTSAPDSSLLGARGQDFTPG